MKNKKILIATGNKSKAEQFKALLKELGINSTTRSLNVLENGKTPKQNAIIKAKAYKQKFPQYIILSDDAGICFDALNGEPGLEARRWMGYFSDDVEDEIWLKHVISQIKKTKGPLTGYIDACWAIYDKKICTKKIKIPFEITLKPIRPYPKGWPLAALQIDPASKKPLFKQNIEERLSEIREEFHDFIKKIL